MLAPVRYSPKTSQSTNLDMYGGRFRTCLSSREDCPCRCCVRRFETRVARLDETACMSSTGPPAVTHLIIHQSALHERRHTAMMITMARIAFKHASQLKHIVIHKASTRSKDNLPATLRRLGDGVKFSRQLADFASAGMRGQRAS